MIKKSLGFFYDKKSLGFFNNKIFLGFFYYKNHFRDFFIMKIHLGIFC